MQKCDDKYIGESERPLKIRFSEHKGYVENNKLNEATGEHFNKKGHSSSDMKNTIKPLQSRIPPLLPFSPSSLLLLCHASLIY